MNYDFAGMCVAQNEKLEKRLKSICKAFLKEYIFAVDIINDSDANERRGEIAESLGQALETAAQKARIAFQNCSRDVVGILEQNVK